MTIPASRIQAAKQDSFRIVGHPDIDPRFAGYSCPFAKGLGMVFGGQTSLVPITAVPLSCLNARPEVLHTRKRRRLDDQVDSRQIADQDETAGICYAKGMATRLIRPSRLPESPRFRELGNSRRIRA